MTAASRSRTRPVTALHPRPTRAYDVRVPRLLAPALTATCALALALAIALAGGAPLPGDAAASASLADLAPLAAVLTQLGSLAVVPPVLVAVCARRRTVAPVVVLLGVQALEAVLSGPLVRAEPMGLGTASSGQTLTAVLGWGLVALQLPGRRALPVGIGMGALVGLSRTSLEVHWGSDVLVGGLVGLLALRSRRPPWPTCRARAPPTARPPPRQRRPACCAGGVRRRGPGPSPPSRPSSPSLRCCSSARRTG